MNDLRLIAFYLPQFHPIPENNLWWGNGFTEWSNVVAARPVFPGHYQPHLPADLGFYDLRLAEVREMQARLAKEHGIYGFCYYYYYFNGKRLLNAPLDENLASGKPDFPFCICWANENWTRKWDGNDAHILIEQIHSHEDDVNFIHQLIPVLQDKRYIRVNTKLLLLVYRVDRMPEPSKTAETWRTIVQKEINEELYLCAVNNFVKDIDPTLIGFDGTVQFPLDFHPNFRVDVQQFANSNGFNYEDIKDHWIIDYPGIINHLVALKKPGYKFFRGVFPAWDNTPRRQHSSAIFINSSPELYKLFLKATMALTRAEHSGDERLVFINAWNEWAEGAHLEPDQQYGMRWLEATKEAAAEIDDIPDALETLKSNCTEASIMVQSNFPLAEKLKEGYTAPITTEVDILLNSFTFRVGKVIMWLPIRLLNVLKWLKIYKHE